MIEAPRPILDVHVVPSGPRNWAVLLEGVRPAVMSTNTQKQAISYGIELAKTAGTSLIIHGQDGRFRDVRSY